tara:strand:+ start:2761 stop:3225 length:465 start_codon:yes stop_codon:yes gene_type:complete
MNKMEKVGIEIKKIIIQCIDERDPDFWIHPSLSEKILNVINENFNEVDKSTFDSILDEAKEMTSGDRMKDYGHPRDNFQNVAILWNAFLMNKVMEVENKIPGELRESQVRFNENDIALMMILLKVAREQSKHKRDNIVDIAGYARNLAQMYEGE